MAPESLSSHYRGRLAPSPTGLLHLGHARTFWYAQTRACERNGSLILRNEDLDRSRCRPEFVDAMLEDLLWFGLRWTEGPDCGGPYSPYTQSERLPFYISAFRTLQQRGLIYPCTCSRQDVIRAVQAPHAGEDEPLYPGTCRPTTHINSVNFASAPSPSLPGEPRINWRFRVADGQEVRFRDARCGEQCFVAGSDFGDFVVWRHDGVPSYQLAAVVDDHAMQISEVVRGEDLLKSTARQLLLYSALGLAIPSFFHCPLMKDPSGVRLAKRHDALSLRALRNRGCSPEEIRNEWIKEKRS